MTIHNTNDASNVEIFLFLVKTYIDAVIIASRELCDFLKLTNLADWRSADVPIKGAFNNGLWKYAFHGSGCAIVTSDYEIDFEFDINCAIGGFDVWRLWSFVCDNQSLSLKFDAFRDKKNVESAFNNAIAQNLIRQEVDGKPSDLYFLYIDK